MAAVLSLSLSLSRVSRSVRASAPSNVAASTLRPPTSTARASSSSPCALASRPLSAAISRSSARTCSSTAATRCGASAAPTRSAPATPSSVASSRCTCASARSPQTASTRRTPAATPVSATILNSPMSPVRATCVPPHSSRLEPMSSTRTVSPYFSPNSISAPSFWASSIGTMRACVAALARISALTMASTCASCALVSGASWLKSKRVRSSSTSEPFCCTWPPRTSRSALCIRCVTLWWRIVRARRWPSTRATKTSPSSTSPSTMRPWWPCTLAWTLTVSSTTTRERALRSSPRSPAWPPLSA